MDCSIRLLGEYHTEQSTLLQIGVTFYDVRIVQIYSWIYYWLWNDAIIVGVFTMTMPNERRWAVNNTRQFLVDLMDPKKTPRVPKEIRKEAYRCLKHYPGDYYMEQAAEQAPEIFGEWDAEHAKPVDSTPYEHNRGRS